MALAADRTLAADVLPMRWRFRTTLSGIAWLTAAQAASGVSVFAVSLVRARALSLDDFGAYALVATVMAFLSIVADFGLSVMLVRDLSRGNVDPRRYLGSAFTLTAGLAITAAAGVVGVSVAISRDTGLATLAGVLAVNVLLVGLATAPAAFLRASGRTRIEAAGRLAAGSTLIGLSALAAAVHGGVVAFGTAAAVSSGVALAVMIPAVVRALGMTWPRADLAHWRSLLADSAPLGIAMLCTAVYYYADSLMLGAYGQHEALARYNASYVFVLAASLLITALRTGFMPAQARGHAGEAPLDRVLRAYFRMTAMMALPLAIAGPVIAGPLLRVSYGARYEAAAPALRLLLVAAGVMCFSSYFGSNLLVTGRQRRYLTATVTGAVVNVTLNLAAIPLFGLTGAAAVTLLSEVLVCALVALPGRDFPGPRLLPALAPLAAGSTALAGVLLLALRVGGL